jgi:hypothetical protein
MVCKLYFKKAVKTEQKGTGRTVLTHSQEGMHLSNKKEQAINSCNNLDECQVHYLSERSQTQKAAHCRTPLIQCLEKRQNHMERKHMSGCHGL